MTTQPRSASLLRIAALIALTLAALPGLSSVRAYPGDGFGLPAAQLYVASSTLLLDLAPLDPATLVDRSDRPTAELGPSQMAVLSTDGSTLAMVGNDAKIIVREGLWGPERIRFFPDGTVGNLTLSPDGTRVIADMIADFSDANLRGPAWKVFDTTDGRLVATAENREPGDQWESWVVSPDASRLYRLVYADGTAEATTSSGPHPTRLIVNDLTSGAEVGRVQLPEILAGFWQGDQTVQIGSGEEQLMHELQPGLAVSSDGGRLAIAHADTEQLTLVDTARLTIERTETVAQSPSLLHRVLSHLSLAPQSASAKALEGSFRQLVFAPDGRHVYLFGGDSSVDNGEPVISGTGLRVVDIETGKVIRQAFGDEQIDRVIPTPDGGSLYIGSPDMTSPVSNGSSASYVLRRVDVKSMHVVTERAFPEWRWFVMQSAIADPTLPLTIELVDMDFVPDLISVPANVPVQLRVVNHGTVQHSFRTGDEETRDWEIRVDLAPGESKTVTINAPAGVYKLICDMKGHAEAGMGGAIVAR